MEVFAVAAVHEEIVAAAAVVAVVETGACRQWTIW